MLIDGETMSEKYYMQPQSTFTAAPSPNSRTQDPVMSCSSCQSVFVKFFWYFSDTLIAMKLKAHVQVQLAKLHVSVYILLVS